MKNIVLLFALCCLLAVTALPGLCGCAPPAPAASETPGPTQTTAQAPSPTPAAGVVEVVVAGYINHGPMQTTVEAIKDVLSKYGSKMEVTWIDLDTEEGAAYFDANHLSAHLNIIINGKVSYMVNDKSVTFMWFEGQGWTRQDLETVLDGLVNN